MMPVSLPPPLPAAPAAEVARNGLPPARPGVSYVWAQNGIFKRGVTADLDVGVSVLPVALPVALSPLDPWVRWAALGDGRINGQLLAHLLDHARSVGPIEQQYFIVYRGGKQCLWRVPQQASSVAVRYEMPSGVAVLVDIHSHHDMPAFFSATDDRDDSGLSVSAVIGRINSSEPEIVARLNVYGHRQIVPIWHLFSSNAVFRDLGEDCDAATRV